MVIREMESAADWELKQVINELMQGQDHAKQLQINLDPSSPPGVRELLIQNIIASYGKALSLLKSNQLVRELHSVVPTIRMESPRSISGSPRSENSNRAFKYQDPRDISKKRKTLPKWTEQVRVSTGMALEGPLDDGYSWRKYGQKDILGAKYPRGYYRCTHRNVLGCQATKQVQRSDEDPSIFDISYRGKHTCHQPSHIIQPMKTQEQQQQQEQEIVSFQKGLKVKTENLDRRDQKNSSSFSFPSASTNYMKPENEIFSPSTLDNNFMNSFCSPFISPATSESNYFSMSPCQMNSCGGGPNLQTAESDPHEIISAMTSASNSSLVDLDFRLDSVDLDPNFPLDAFFT
ncbi:probable WRKY transcription factor 53 [Magnolia sinica]|uniref:probable WRKY transcription factor 53 n=1 Tax=Magnolia sinica TaxID=86752 RepID=UPI002659C26E|nr:probable WRKY transcription factor 53 [Magnolia sinica]